MPTLKQLIHEYGMAMFNAGVHEREDDGESLFSQASKLFENICWIVSDAEDPKPKKVKREVDG